MKLEDIVSKDKIPKGMSYPCQTSDLMPLIDNSKIHISYGFRKNPWGDNNNLRLDIMWVQCYSRKLAASSVVGNEFFMSVQSVPGKLRARIREKLRVDVIPFFKEWILKRHFGHILLAKYEMHKYKLGSSIIDNTHAGLYIEDEKPNRKLGERGVIVYQDKSFDIDELMQEFAK